MGRYVERVLPLKGKERRFVVPSDLGHVEQGAELSPDELRSLRSVLADQNGVLRKCLRLRSFVILCDANLNSKVVTLDFQSRRGSGCFQHSVLGEDVKVSGDYAYVNDVDDSVIVDVRVRIPAATITRWSKAVIVEEDGNVCYGY